MSNTTPAARSNFFSSCVLWRELALATALAGCGDDGGSSSGMSSTSATEPTTDPTADPSDSGTGTGTSGETDDSTATSSSSSSTSTSSATDATTDDTSASRAPCDDDHLPYAGLLCGPPERPCLVGADEAIDPEPRFRNEAPAIALDLRCDPEVLFSIAEGGYHGRFARRLGGGAWSVDETPFPLARVGLVHDRSADAPLALAYDGAFGTSLWQHAAGQWSQLSAAPGQNTATAHAFARSAQGVVHAAAVTDDAIARHLSYDGAWHFSPLGDNNPASAALVLDPAGQPHITFWTVKDAEWVLSYAAPPAPAEQVLPLGSNFLAIARHGVAEAAGELAVLAARQLPNGLHELVLARRAAGVWQITPVLAEDDQGAALCAGEPQADGQLCEYDYVRLSPFGALAGGPGEFRLFFRRTRHRGVLIAECTDLPFPVCTWQNQSDQSESELRIAWPTDQGVAWATALTDAFFTDLTATVDADGRIHIAAYDARPLEEITVRYVRLE